MTAMVPRARVWLALAALVVLAASLSSCYIAPYPYRGVAVVGPPVVVFGHRCWRCW
jgi:hypothetical protein